MTSAVPPTDEPPSTHAPVAPSAPDPLRSVDLLRDLDPLRDLVAVMDRMRSPGGCPWDAEQTHESLVRYLLEETYELVETIETDDRPGLREELGDVLFQVVFHARVAQEHPDDPFTLDDVASDLTAKLRRRHPHVFGDDEYVDAAHLTARWDAIKQEEKARGSVLDGIPLAQGSLSRAQKVLVRVRRAGLDDLVGLATDERDAHGLPDAAVDGAAAGDEAAVGAAEPDVVAVDPAVEVGDQLLAVVLQAQAAGVDAEGALRATVRRLEAEVRRAEQAERAG